MNNEQDTAAVAVREAATPVECEPKITLTPRQTKNFWAKVEKIDAPDGCWIWVGSLTRKGYGHFRVGDKLQSTHRISYNIHVGAVPKGLFVLHKCDVRNCIRAEHLFLGTNQDNMDDMVKKKRYFTGVTDNAPKPPVLNLHNVPAGEKTYNAKLTEWDVRAIHRLYKDEGWSQSKLAKQFCVGQMQVCRILRGERWRHLGLEPIKSPTVQDREARKQLELKVT